VTTKYDAEAIKAAAGKLGSIMDDMAPFSALKVTVPNAGSFDLATWLEKIVQDRVDGIVLHAEHLKIALADMQTALTTIATDFDNADGDNAEQIKSSITDMEKHVTDDISQASQGDSAPTTAGEPRTLRSGSGPTAPGEPRSVQGGSGPTAPGEPRSVQGGSGPTAPGEPRTFQSNSSTPQTPKEDPQSSDEPAEQEPDYEPAAFY